MIDFKAEIAEIIKKAGDLNSELVALNELAVDEIKESIEIPQDAKNGDYAFPCFRLAKALRKAPPMIAGDIAAAISGASLFDRVEQVNAYVNMFIDKAYLAKELIEAVAEEGDSYGRSNEGAGKKVIVEFSSPNIAKPFHIGHIRSTVIGNSIYKLYDAVGYDVTRINHLGDYGTQFGKMIVAYKKWGDEAELAKEPIKTLLGYYTRFHEEAKAHPELEDEAREAFARLEAGEAEETALWEKFRELSLAEFNRVYSLLGIEFDSYAGESFYSDKMPRFIDELKEKELLIKSQGAQIVDLEAYGMSPAMITKSDGSSLYVTRDIAAAVYRKEFYDFYKCIYVVASQQNLHFKQWKKVLELMGYDWQEDCVHVPFGLVSLADGEDTKMMSTREGTVVFLEDVLNTAIEKTKAIMMEKENPDLDIDEVSKQVGIGAVIFQELSNNRIKDYVFDWDNVLNFDGETGPYVQYTHARACSVLRKAGVKSLDANELLVNDIDYSYLASDAAYSLIKLIYRVPEVIKDAAEKYEPSILTRHLIDIAQAFNKFYHDEHILVDNEDEKNAKLVLVYTAKTVIKNCLTILGIAAPERM